MIEIVFASVPIFVKDNLSILAFFAVLTYALFFLHWISTTDWEEKYNWFSLLLALSGILHLHYANVQLLHQYELFFFTCWVAFLSYHLSTWRNNFDKVHGQLQNIASLKPYQGSVFRYFITLPTSKSATGHWNPPHFSNFLQIILSLMYGCLIFLHIIPFVTPSGCMGGGTSPLCCRYNYVVKDFDMHSVNADFCSGRVRIAFAGGWSTGKTSVINALLGHKYSTSQVAPAPTTDKFVCLVMNAPYSDPIRNEDYQQRKHCEIMGHINDVTHKICGDTLPDVLDVADVNTEFEDFVFFDMPGWQTEYGKDCMYSTFFKQMIAKMDFVYIVWDVAHGKIEDEFANFFKDANKARGTNYDIIYNRFQESSTDMSFLNQQYAKLRNGQEVLSQKYTMRLHENSSQYQSEYQHDIALLRARVKSVRQTVHDNRKKLMKENLQTYRSQLSGLFSLRKLKIGDRLISEDLNVHIRPKKGWLRHVGIEL
jgi:hypothetical protein